jgi:hypothetical protein
MDAVEKIEYKGYAIEIIQDEDGLNPRSEWDNLATMICFHNRYTLGDKHDYRSPGEMMRSLAIEADPYLQDRIEYWEDGKGWAQLQNHYPNRCGEIVDEKINEMIQSTIEKHYITLPLYLYDHSGITMSTSPFSCPWDSGQVGIIYISKAKALVEYGWKRLTKSNRAKIISYLVSEVEVYDQYLTGDCYGYHVHKLDEDGEIEDESDILDSCWGFFGHDWEENGLFEHAKPAIDYHIKQMAEAEEHYRNCWAL